MATIIADSWVKANVVDMKKSLAFYAKLGLKPTMKVPSYSELTMPGGTVLGLHQVEIKGNSRKKIKPSESGY